VLLRGGGDGLFFLRSSHGQEESIAKMRRREEDIWVLCWFLYYYYLISSPLFFGDSFSCSASAPPSAAISRPCCDSPVAQFVPFRKFCLCHSGGLLQLSPDCIKGPHDIPFPYQHNDIFASLFYDELGSFVHWTSINRLLQRLIMTFLIYLPQSSL